MLREQETPPPRRLGSTFGPAKRSDAWTGCPVDVVGPRQEDEAVRIGRKPRGIPRIMALVDDISLFAHDQALSSLVVMRLVAAGSARVVSAHTGRLFIGAVSWALVGGARATGAAAIVHGLVGGLDGALGVAL